MPKKFVKDAVIRDLIRRGKTYTEIIIICRCSPSRISVIKKKMEAKAATYEN
jgi:predicted CopG family antitoxin